MKTDEQKDQAMTNPPDGQSGEATQNPEPTKTAREKAIAFVWVHDALAGHTWRCPDCGSQATLGGNAAFHCSKSGHEIPTLVPLQHPPIDHAPTAADSAPTPSPSVAERQRIREEHAAIASHNTGRPGMPQGPCQCSICEDSPSVGEPGTLTPRHDAVYHIRDYEQRDYRSKEYDAMSDLAETLERENQRLTGDLAQAKAQLAQGTATLVSVACVSVEQLKGRYLNLMERSNRRDLPYGFNSWEDFYNHIQGITKERDALRSQVEALTKERDEVIEHAGKVEKSVWESGRENARLTTALAAAEKDSERLDALHRGCWSLECYSVPTGGDDADVGWHVIEHHIAEPRNREIGFGDTPAQAIDRAQQPKGADER